MSVPKGTVDPQGTDGVLMPSVHTRQGKQVTHSPVVGLTTLIDWLGRQSSSTHRDLTWTTDTCQNKEMNTRDIFFKQLTS